jgi:raffinose/stachyose/melibiose transport system permease protein
LKTTQTKRKRTAESDASLQGEPRRKPGLSALRKKTVVFGSWIWALPSLAAVLVIHYIATYIGGTYAFTDFNGISDANWVGFDNFIRIGTDPQTMGAIGNTFFIAIIYFIGVNIIGLGLALALNRGLKTRYFLRVLMFLPVVLSSLAVSYIFKFIFDFEGPLNQVRMFFGQEPLLWLADTNTAIWTIIIVAVWQNSGLGMVIYLAGLATVPPELEESAAIDGAGVFSRFWHITLPMIQPAIAITTTLSLLTGLRIFDQVVAMTGGGPFGATDTMSTIIYRITFEYSDFGYGTALATVFAVVLALAAVLQLFITKDRSGR